jgi:malate synthase
MTEVLYPYLTPHNMEIFGSHEAEYYEILTPQALTFIKELHLKFDDERKLLMKKRIVRQQEIDSGSLPDFLTDTEIIRMSDWKVAPVLNDLQDRRVEITGPVDRKMIINALNSGANVFMADFEDSNSPSWTNVMDGQINLRDANRKEIDYINPANNKAYKLNEKTATLLVRPRGWHLEEKHLEIFEQPISGSLFDFGLYFFHNVKQLMENGSAPYFYLPKLESHLEARLWNKVFEFSQEYMDVPKGTIKATVLIETILASFELDEILYELRDHSAGLNCGRWDYIFSYIKKLHNLGYMLPDRSEVTMTTPFMKAYSERVIQVCHKRGAHAIGGMAAQIPIKNDEQANNAAMEKVRQDKIREAKAGHDGTWVAHPGLVHIAKEIFDEYMPQKNQLDNLRKDLNVTADNLLEKPQGKITEAGVRLNINVGILYVESWLQGVGAAAIYNLMEDAATAEISRTQLWQWLKASITMDDGQKLTYDKYEIFKLEELEKIKTYVGNEYFQNGMFEEAIELFDDLIKSTELPEFLTLEAYKKL